MIIKNTTIIDFLMLVITIIIFLLDLYGLFPFWGHYLLIPLAISYYLYLKFSHLHINIYHVILLFIIILTLVIDPVLD